MKFCLDCSGEYADDKEFCPRDGTPLVARATDQLLGTVVGGKYMVEALISKGSMGAVYRGAHVDSGKPVAMKVLHSFLGDDKEALMRFYREAKATSRLNHTHIVAIYDFGTTALGQPYIVMELVQGLSLEALLEQRQHLSLEDVLPVMRQVCDALQHAHEHGIIHRDIKPENIVLEEKEGFYGHVKLIDFGIAKFIQGSDDTHVKLTRTGTICGSPAYMSPEQVHDGPLDHRSDIYSLAVVLFELLTGRVPFVASDIVKLLYQHAAGEPPALKDVRAEGQFSAALEKVVAKALAKNPEQRHASMLEFWDDLQAAAREPASTEAWGAGLAVVAGSTGTVPGDKPDSGASPGPAMAAESAQAAPRSGDAEAGDGPAAAAAAAEPNRTRSEGGAPAEPASWSRLPDSSASPRADDGAYRRRLSDVPVAPREPQGQEAHAAEGEPAASGQALSGGVASGASQRLAVPRNGPETAAGASRPREAKRPHTGSHSELPIPFRAENRAPDKAGSGASLWLLVGAGVFGCFLVFMLAVPSFQKKPDAEALLSQGKPEDAFRILATRRLEGKLTDEDLDLQDRIYLSLAKKRAALKQYDVAIQMLRKIPAKSRQAREASQLVRQYKALR